MTDRELLAAIEKIVEPIQADIKSIEEKFEPIQADIKRIEEKFDTEIGHLKVILENEIPRRFDALADGQKSFLGRQKQLETETAKKIEELDGRVLWLERKSIIAESDIEKLKEAQ